MNLLGRKKSGWFTKKKIGFSFIEVILTMSLFLLLAGVGLGAYFQYYSFSFINADVNKTLTLIKKARFQSLKNPNNSDYGIHIDSATRTITSFRNIYNPLNTENDLIQLERLNVLDLSLNPSIGTTNEIIFEKQSGKTLNSGSFTIGNADYSYTITINSQGVIN